MMDNPTHLSLDCIGDTGPAELTEKLNQKPKHDAALIAAG